VLAHRQSGARLADAGRRRLEVGQPYRADAWITYNTDLQPSTLVSVEQLQQLAAERPDDLVLILGDCDDGDPSYEFCTDVTRAAAAEADGDVQRPRLVPVSRLAGGS